MSAVTPSQAADAVVVRLNARFQTDPSVRFTAARVGLIRFDASELDALTVSVIPRSSESEYLTRGAVAREIGVDVAVQKRLGTAVAPVTEIDALVGAVETIRAYLMSPDASKLSTLGDVRLVGAKIDPLYYQDHLLEKGVFTSVIGLTYQYAEALE